MNNGTRENFQETVSSDTVPLLGTDKTREPITFKNRNADSKCIRPWILRILRYVYCKGE